MTPPPIRRALLSLFDKRGILAMAKFLDTQGIAILSTGGTANQLRQEKIKVQDIAEVTGFPEILSGRVKTLHPIIHAAILARRDDPEHRQALKKLSIDPIDLVIVNLYPFAETAAREKNREAIIEMIDVGGPTMIRAAAKNHADVVILTDPEDYPAAMKAIAESGTLSLEHRQRLAAKAFARTAAYERAIAQWFASEASQATQTSTFQERETLYLQRQSALRYGENPHQKGAFYTFKGVAPSGFAHAVLHQGKAMSWNNLNDAQCAVTLASEFSNPAAVIVKHATPCGVAVADTPAQAWCKALACDRQSAYGGIVAFNHPVDRETAEKIVTVFLEVVIAPEFSKEALKILAKKSLMRLVQMDIPSLRAPMIDVRSIAGGVLLQESDPPFESRDTMRVVSQRQPSPTEWRDMIFAGRVCKHVRSNAIVYARDGASIGIGGGQTSRVQAARLARLQMARLQGAQLQATDRGATGGEVTDRGASEKPTACVAASDAFFPFADGLEEIIRAGARAVLQPGGSKRDEEVIAAADAADLAMVFTGKRHFRH